VEADADWPRKDNFYHGLERPGGGCRSGSGVERGVRPHRSSQEVRPVFFGAIGARNSACGVQESRGLDCQPSTMSQPRRPLLEVLSWIAGIIGACIAGYQFLKAETAPGFAATAGGSVPQATSTTTSTTTSTGTPPASPRRQASAAVLNSAPRELPGRDSLTRNSSPELVIAPDGGASRLRTKRGELLIVGNYGDPQRPLFNGQELGAIELAPSVSVLGAAVWPDRVGFILEQSCGGSGCPPFYSVLLVRDGGYAKLLSSEELGNTLEPKNLSVRGNGVAMDFGFVNKKRTIGVFNGEDLKVEKTLLKGVAISDEYCRWLHTDALAKSCLSPLGSCSNTPSHGYTMRGYFAMKADEPGFRPSAFERLCKTLCEQGRTIEYAAFRSTVCVPES